MFDEHAQPLAVVDQRAQRPGFAGIVRQPGEFPPGAREHVVERRPERVLRRVERGALTLGPGVVAGQPRLVEAVDGGDPLEPCPAPAGEVGLPGGALDEVASLMAPTVLQDHQAAEQARQLPVGAVAVADQHRAGPEFPEQGPRRLRAAARVDVEVHGIVADGDPQPGAGGTALRAQRLHPPAGLVGVAQHSRVPVRPDRLGKRFEQRHEAPHAVGQRPGGDRQPLVGQPRLFLYFSRRATARSAPP